MSHLERLPLVKSIEETVALWPDMNLRQRLGASAASLITAAGPIGRILIETHQGKDQELSAGHLIAGLAVDLRDGLDGKIARATDGVTPFGKEFDPLADKIDFLIQELFQYQRGNLPIAHLALRISRDALVTALRSHVMAATDGRADVGADWTGKFSTGARQASLRITGLPFERDVPHLRTTHQTTATGLILWSGARNVSRLLDEKAKYTDKSA